MFYEEQSSRELEKVVNNPKEWWKLLKKNNFIEEVISGRCLQGV